jgi:hypothetical protein
MRFPQRKPATREVHEPCIRVGLMENLMSQVQNGRQDKSRADPEADGAKW